MAKTATPEPSRSYTFEDVWAALMEDRAQIQAMREQAQEDNRLMREQMREQRQETDRILREQMQETTRKMELTDKRIGYLGNRFGELAEHLVAPNIMEKFNNLGFTFTRVADRTRIKDPVSRQTIAETDLILENDDFAIVVEVKSKPDKDDVQDHIERIEKLRRAFDMRNDRRKISGAIAGAILSDTMRRLILKTGFFLIEQTGDTVCINIPDGFIPREW